MLNKIKKIIVVACSFVVYSVCYLYCKIRKINNDNVWLISERGTDARDNAYHFYKFIKQNHPEVDIRFVISKKSADRNKIDENDIINFKSFKHYILFITAGKLISTHIMGFSPDYSLYWRMDQKKLLKIRGKRIFLQHGITQNYISIMDAKVSKVDLFVCGAKPEYDYILSRYGYGKNVAKYLGFARYDNLDSKQENQILIMPTWRKWIKYTNDFSKTLYFKKWNSLLNNKEFIKFVKKNKIKVIFYPHYEIQPFIHYFNTKSDNIVIADFDNYDVQKLLKESKILITDYSSVHFDFAYMKKNVIYYQFDKEEFKKKHYSEGYYDYDTMAFGPVVQTEDNTIKSVLKLYNDSENNNLNINKFFTIRDKNNCKRIYDEIVKL